jgi:hypothetical protein
VKTSPFDLDQQHVAFHKECVDHQYGRRDAQPQVIIVPPSVAAAMDWPEPEKDAAPFERREIIFRPPGEAAG